MYASIALKICSLVLVVIATGLWAGAGVETRPKYRDEQTLVGGAIWCQSIMSIGLLISKIVEEIDSFVEGYYLLAGVILLFGTGICLVCGECKSMIKHRRSRVQVNLGSSKVSVTRSMSGLRYDKTYFTIGILALLSGVLTFSEFIILVVS